MDFILDASFALHWCFEDEITAAADLEQICERIAR